MLFGATGGRTAHHVARLAIDLEVNNMKSKCIEDAESNRPDNSKTSIPMSHTLCLNTIPRNVHGRCKGKLVNPTAT